MDRKFLDLYSDYLISSFGKITATGLSELLDGELSHNQITSRLSKVQEVHLSYGIWSNRQSASMKAKKEYC